MPKSRETMPVGFGDLPESVARFSKGFVGEVPEVFLLSQASGFWMQQVSEFRQIELLRRADGTLENERDVHRAMLTALIHQGEILRSRHRVLADDSLMMSFKAEDLEATLELLLETQWLDYGPKLNPERAKRIAASLDLSYASA